MPLIEVGQAIQIQTPALSVIKKSEGATETTAMIAELLKPLAMFFAVGKHINTPQLIETAKLILETYYFLKIEDLKICFTRMKLGHYGPLYDRFDGQVILICIKDYCEERINVAETLSLEKHKETLALESSEELYVIESGDSYLLWFEDSSDWTKVRQDATTMEFEKAMRVKKFLLSNDIADDCKIAYANKPLITLMEHFKKNAPQLVDKKTKYQDAVSGYFEKRNAIDADELLSPLEKENAKRKLSGLGSISEAEFNERVEMINKQSC